MKVIKEKTEAFGYSFEITNKGCGIITIEGENNEKDVYKRQH